MLCQNNVRSYLSNGAILLPEIPRRCLQPEVNNAFRHLYGQAQPL